MPTPTNPRSVTILLLRHGQSEWNAVHRWQGTADSPLTELGRRQAAETAIRLAGLGLRFRPLWASDLSRAHETASIIGTALGVDGLLVDPRLREAHAGEWEGLTPDDIELRWPGWLSAHRRPPSFEPFHAVVERTIAALHELAAASMQAASMQGVGDAALVVAHSGVIRSVIRHLGHDDDRIPNLGGVWLEVTTDRSTIDRTDHGITLVDLFDPAGIVISGVDAPGEDPGDETDETEADRSAQH